MLQLRTSANDQPVSAVSVIDINLLDVTAPEPISWSMYNNNLHYGYITVPTYKLRSRNWYT